MGHSDNGLCEQGVGGSNPLAATTHTVSRTDRGEERMTRLLGFGVILAAVLVLGAGPALAWNCPVQIKAAEDAIKRAEAMKLSPEAKGLVEDAKKLVAESKKHHSEAKAKIDHANAMWKAKAALAQAEAAASIST